MQQRFREEEGLAAAVAPHVDVEERPEEHLRFLVVFGVGFAGKLAARPDRRHVAEVVRYLVVEVHVGKGHLAAPAARKLVELEDQLLRELEVFVVIPADRVGGEVHIHGVPADGARKMVLQHRGHLQHVREEDVGVLGGVGNARY
ncbi:hypothetical protein SDC9_152857 [bioreactor metagenome]|uniref:Uncharacterized protein n=1 Tax=bioreactor metagenome TaxID=1076179 RepID=A0A645EVZ8_9ZZZZ